MELRILFEQQGCFGGFANRIQEIVVSSINSWSWTLLNYTIRMTYQTNWNSNLNANFHPFHQTMFLMFF